MSEILIGDLYIKILDPISDELVMAFGTKGAEWQTTLANSYYFKRRFPAAAVDYIIDLKALLIAPDLLAVRVSDPITLTYKHSSSPAESTANLRANGVWIYTCRGYIDETTPGEYIDTVKLFITVDNTEVEFLAGSRGVDGENIAQDLGGGLPPLDPGGGGGTPIDPNPSPEGGG